MSATAPATASPILTICRRALADRLRLALYCGAGLAALALVGVGAFAGLNSDEFFQGLPPAYDNLVGGSAGGNYAVSETFGLTAPIVVLVIAISGGVGAVAGEERDRTAELLLAQPVPRRDLVVAKAAALAVHLVAAIAIFLAGFLAADALFDSGVATSGAAATAVHLLALGLAFAMIALALSSWTGSASLSTGVATGLAVVADLMASMLPLVKGAEGAAKASAWYYYNGSAPLENGLDPGHLLVLMAIAAAGFAIALVGIRRRDIESGARSRGMRITALDRFIRPRVNTIFVKSVSERIVLATLAGAGLASMAVVVALMFGGLQGTLRDFTEKIPEAVAGFYGSGDLGTAAGWMNAEMLSIFVPGVVIAVAVVLGAGAIAGEQKSHTLGLLLAAPVSRRRVVVEKAAALGVLMLVVCLISGLGIGFGSLVAGLGLNALNITAAMTHAALLASLFGALALALGSITSARAATRITVLAALVAYIAQSLLPTKDSVKGLAPLSPWHYYDSSTPLANGFDLLHLLVLAALTAVAFAVALVLVDRREVSA